LAAVAEQMPEKKSIEVKVQAEVAALDREIQNRWKELGRLNQDFKSDEKTLSAKALTDRQDEIIRKEKDLSEYYEKRSSEIKRSATDVSGAFSKLIRSALADMANQKGFDLIFDKENGRLLYANDRFDRTGDLQSVLKRGRDVFATPALNATNTASSSAGSRAAP
jgi:Skp family chaperone for outer membrane proteins